ncbi:5-hydroxytryptamine receptor 3A-like [Branchiostoma floridae]|uniref:5-hydroxytryptamine receptor 3A-like n=1 Tax=Branchiostoma floridae TaxID=7739 RepID=A0A9J7KM00_BRAFL|nr:5-hydroxytryptamine receptor 3A-like [Branchiostoma floridae]
MDHTACLTMTLKRDPTYHYATTISPCLILIVLMIITFIMPIDKGDRIGFGVTILLSMVVSLVVVTGFLPVSSALPFIAMLIIVCMALMALFMLSTLFIIIIHDKKGPVPKWARTLFLKNIARALLMGDLTKKLKSEEPRRPSTSDKVSDTEGYDNHSFNMHIDGSSSEEESPSPDTRNAVGTALIGLKGSVDELKVSVRQLSVSIDAMTQASRGDDDDKVAEYALLANVLDRLNLVLYIIAICVAIPCTLLIGRPRIIPN